MVLALKSLCGGHCPLYTRTKSKAIRSKAIKVTYSQSTLTLPVKWLLVILTALDTMPNPMPRARAHITVVF